MALRDMEGRELQPAETPLMRALERREQISGEQLKIARPDGQERVIAISATSADRRRRATGRRGRGLSRHHGRGQAA